MEESMILGALKTSGNENIYDDVVREQSDLLTSPMATPLNLSPSPSRRGEYPTIHVHPEGGSCCSSRRTSELSVPDSRKESEGSLASFPDSRKPSEISYTSGRFDYRKHSEMSYPESNPDSRKQSELSFTGHVHDLRKFSERNEPSDSRKSSGMSLVGAISDSRRQSETSYMSDISDYRKISDVNRKGMRRPSNQSTSSAQDHTDSLPHFRYYQVGQHSLRNSPDTIYEQRTLAVPISNRRPVSIGEYEGDPEYYDSPRRPHNLQLSRSHNALPQSEPNTPRTHSMAHRLSAHLHEMARATSMDKIHHRMKGIIKNVSMSSENVAHHRYNRKSESDTAQSDSSDSELEGTPLMPSSSPYKRTNTMKRKPKRPRGSNDHLPLINDDLGPKGMPVNKVLARLASSSCGTLQSSQSFSDLHRPRPLERQSAVESSSSTRETTPVSRGSRESTPMRENPETIV